MLLLAGITGLAGCANHYAALRANPADTVSVLPKHLVLSRALYRCVIDGRFLFKRYHFSGVLLFRQLADSTTRVVFANESGLTFFDFAWSKTDSFSIVRVIPQLDKPAVIKTFRKDIELLLYKIPNPSSEQSFSNPEPVVSHSDEKIPKTPERWHRFTLERGYVYYVRRENALRLIETTSGRKPVTSIRVSTRTDDTALSDTITVIHHRAHFTISATKIRNEYAE